MNRPWGTDGTGCLICYEALPRPNKETIPDYGTFFIALNKKIDKENWTEFKKGL